MTREQQEEYVRSLCQQQQKYMLERLPRVPENWDGIELRNWFVRVAEEGYKFKMDRRRTADFNNTIIVQNL